ncbi:ribosome biogenesis GTP-binding protein YihA/YsxC [Hymenobacter negativus]|uniref:Probable GTP-binding protein EngB n=1 Tax=Hymenobacter negativus TaxID=2795026 RepID=A0ABS0Q361_9BACT|nr:MULTISPECIES: ribosome biogenesis GTP-binding protein YihA/YsxC [Bacteria]MBH8556788.1 YihA family ribosome biogenesis GTP-binding protein [Hymenobacter negativus]MBH8569036.1 YihA family ribosome biogenesis GTP-binding protein [Hymenobacter negativus]MBR7208771.1 YihA family ribosome biogenesis GTP-binding protein [Microvirga sp. STS02]
MIIHDARFLTSNSRADLCPAPTLPEYAFIGRSNVGKSSLINMLTERKALAKTSSSPGKTQLINHFIINDNWFLVDLPGYGYAKVSKAARAEWAKMINYYLRNRANLMCVCVLIDSRHAPQAVDLEFMEKLGEEGIPFVMVFTKADKQSTAQTKALVTEYLRKMSEIWDELPRYFLTSAETGLGRDEVLDFIAEVNSEWKADAAANA